MFDSLIIPGLAVPKVQGLDVDGLEASTNVPMKRQLSGICYLIPSNLSGWVVAMPAVSR